MTMSIEPTQEDRAVVTQFVNECIQEGLSGLVDMEKAAHIIAGHRHWSCAAEAEQVWRDYQVEVKRLEERLRDKQCEIEELERLNLEVARIAEEERAKEQGL